MPNEYNDWHREAARQEYLDMSCVDVSEPRRYVKRRQMECGECGRIGIPERTQNSGGATNYRFCPICKGEWFKEKE